jgi:ferritin-like metal-binding protein YciE
MKTVARVMFRTQGQIKTLHRFKSIGKKASGEKCDAIEGLTKEAEGVIEEAKGGPQSVADDSGIVYPQRQEV